MKKLLTLFACAALLGTACTKEKDDNGGKVRTYDVSVRLVYPEGSELSAVEGVEVRMANGSSGTVTTATTDAAGAACFKLPEGIYEAAATDRRSVEGYTYTLNALKSNVVVSAATWNEGMTVDLELVASKAGQILIKEVYSGGCQKDDGSGFYQYDKYMVVYNNSDQQAEIRNFCVGMAGPYNADASINNYTDGKLFYADAGYTPTICAYWYLKKDLVLEPYASASIVLCGAINHTVAYQNSVDLSRADYCTYDPEVFSNTSYYPAPAESIPAENYLKAVFFGKGNAWPVSIVGPAMFIFSTGDEDPAAWGLNTENRYYFPGKENNDVYGCTKIPNDWILDAVEIYGADKVTESFYGRSRRRLCRAGQQAGILDLPQCRPGGHRGVERECRKNRLRIRARDPRLQGRPVDRPERHRCRSLDPERRAHPVPRYEQQQQRLPSAGESQPEGVIPRHEAIDPASAAAPGHYSRDVRRRPGGVGRPDGAACPDCPWRPGYP